MIESFWTFGIMDPVRSFNRGHGNEGDLILVSSISGEHGSTSELTVFAGFWPSSVNVAEDKEIGVRGFDSFNQLHIPTR
jgi:hypothetical protein